MNPFIKKQCQNMELSLTTFLQSCKVAALQDDGMISKEEEKLLKRLEKASEKFRAEIQKAMND